MTYLEQLRSHRDARNAIWLQFAQRHAIDPTTVFLFFEDRASQALYMPLVRTHFSAKELRPLPCRNKKDILELHDRISVDGAVNRRTLFFVDRDHDDYISGKQASTHELFVTTWYSVENYIVTREVYLIILRDKLCIDCQVFDINASVETFVLEYERFVSLIRPFMIWTIVHRRQGAVNLANIDLANVFEMSESQPIRKRPHGFRYFKIQSQATGKTVMRDLINTMKSLKFESAKALTRGKFELWFLLAFLRRVKDQVNRSRTRGDRAPLINIDINRETIFALIAEAWGCDPRLSDFLATAAVRFSHHSE